MHLLGSAGPLRYEWGYGQEMEFSPGGLVNCFFFDEILAGIEAISVGF